MFRYGATLEGALDGHSLPFPSGPSVGSTLEWEHIGKIRYKSYIIPGETLIPGGRGEGGRLEREAFHPGIGYASYLALTTMN